MKIKICGLTHPEDAEYAAGLGADLIGIIFALRSKRLTSQLCATEIAHAARQAGAQPVGVFIEQNAEEIEAICAATGINIVQLHGPTAKQAYALLQGRYSIIYALPVQNDGSVLESSPAAAMPLYDYFDPLNPTGASFNWNSFCPPPHTPWMLAGGLKPQNVCAALALLKPSGVDVCGGVEAAHSTRKDPALVKAFIHAVKNRKEPL